MGNDRLITLGEMLYQGQTRLAYYLMTVNASAIVLTLGRVETAECDHAMLLLLLSVLSWVIAFLLGIRHLENKNAAILANIQAIKVEEGTHEIPFPESLTPEAQRRLSEEFRKFNDRARHSIRWQTWLMIAGAVLYATWLVVRKFVAE